MSFIGYMIKGIPYVCVWKLTNNVNKTIHYGDLVCYALVKAE